MVTDHSNTVYECGSCTLPVHQDRLGFWVHFAHVTACLGGPVVEKQLPLPVRVGTPTPHYGTR